MDLRPSAEFRAGVEEATRDPSPIIAQRNPGVAVIQLQRQCLDTDDMSGVQLDEPEQPQVVAQGRIDPVVVDEVPEVEQCVPAS